MPALNLTPSTRSGLATVRDLPESVFNAIVSALERSPDSIPSVQTLSSQDMESLKDAIDAMYAVRAYHGVPLEEFVDDILESLEFEKEIEPSAAAPMRARLIAILNIAPLRVSAKAALLHAEYEHSFCSARILTDIRPIYDNGVKGPPSGAIIMHTLKLSYHEGAKGELSEIYFSMGSDDILELQRALERATDKATSLRGVLESAKLRCIDPQK